MKRRSFLAGAAAAVGSAPLAGATVEASAGASFRLNGDEFRLLDVLAPAQGETFAAEAAAILSDILQRGRLDLADRPPGRDRWNRRVVAAGVETPEGVRSVQELLTLEGGARVRPESDDRAAIERLLAAEEAARAAGRGLWRMPFYAVRDASTHRATGAFHVLEGTVVSAALTKGRAYLNFGEDYRTDVTATAASRDARRWAKDGLDWEALAGKTLRIRGYVAWINGPSIEISHPLQITMLGV